MLARRHATSTTTAAEKRAALEKAWEDEWRAECAAAAKVATEDHTQGNPVSCQELLHINYKKEMEKVFKELKDNKNIMTIAIQMNLVQPFTTLLDNYQRALQRELNSFVSWEDDCFRGRHHRETTLDPRKFRHVMTSVRALKALNESFSLDNKSSTEAVWENSATFKENATQSGINPGRKILEIDLAIYIGFFALTLLFSVLTMGVGTGLAAGLIGLYAFMNLAFPLMANLLIIGHYHPVINANRQGEKTALGIQSIFNKYLNKDLQDKKENKEVRHTPSSFITSLFSCCRRPG